MTRIGFTGIGSNDRPMTHKAFYCFDEFRQALQMRPAAAKFRCLRVEGAAGS